MKIIPYFILHFTLATNYGYGVPNFCTVSNTSDCLSKNLTINIIKDDILLTTSKTTESYDEAKYIKIECLENMYKVVLPMNEVAFWKTGDVMHLSSLSTFPRSKSCIEVYCSNEEESNNLITCVSKPILPVCDELKNKTTPNIYNYVKNRYRNTLIKIGDHKSVVQVQTKSVKSECDNDEKQYNISVLNDGTSDLAIHGNILHLVHRHSPIALPNHIQSPKFCLSFDYFSGRIKSKYCIPDHKNIEEKACQGKNCVKKCCPPGYIYDGEAFSCIPAFHSKNLWQPDFYNTRSYNLSTFMPNSYSLVIGMPHCSDFYSATSSDVLKLLSNGSLLLENGKLIFPPIKYCIDNFKYGEDIFEEAFVCFEEETAAVRSSCGYVGKNVYPILLLISSIFLLFTIITYCMVPELYAKIQNKSLLSSVTALLSAYLTLAFGQLYSYLISQEICIALGLFIQFSVLASFFWLNVMCFDIWHNLRSVKPNRDQINNPKKKFAMYSLYGWGCPLVISSITAIMQLVVDQKSNPNLIFPKIGETDCFFSSNDPISRWIYLYSFICGILILNILFFIHLAIILVRAQHASDIILGKRGQYREWIKLYIKLFFVMGVSWLFEAISWHKEICAVWIATDIINALRGLFIFLIFVCKRNIYQKFKNRNNPRLSQATNTAQSSFLRSSTKNSTKIDQRNVIGLLEPMNQRNSQTGEDSIINTSRN